MTMIYNPPEHPWISITLVMGESSPRVLLSKDGVTGLMMTPWEARNLGLVLMEVGLHQEQLLRLEAERQKTLSTKNPENGETNNVA